MPSSHTVRVRGAMRRFEGGHRALAGADLDLVPGRITALLGPSGSGKSTLLRAVAGLEQLDAGEIHFGHTPWSTPGHHLPPEARRVGLVFQDYALFPHMTALDNVAFGLTGADRKARAMAELEAAELGDKARNYPHELSGGEQQRVALARALAPRPALVLLDEPFSGLDRRLRGEVRRRTMDLLRASGAAVLLVTHDAEEAMESAEELTLMSEGRVIQSGPPREVWFNPVSETSARLTGDVNVWRDTCEDGLVDTPLGRIRQDGLVAASVATLIRPQALKVTPNRDGRATVVQARPAGGVEHLILRTQDGSEWLAHAPAPCRLREGDAVDIDINPDFVRVIPLGRPGDVMGAPGQHYKASTPGL